MEENPNRALRSTKTADVYLTPEECAPICDEYNDLVNELVDDVESIKRLRIIFDEGANRFRHPRTAARLYTLADMQRQIADYKKVLESRNTGE
jgi:hypothetical protein